MSTATTWLETVDQALNVLEQTGKETTAEQLEQAVTQLQNCQQNFTELAEAEQNTLAPQLPKVLERITRATTALQNAQQGLSGNHTKVLKTLQAAQAYGTVQNRK